MINIGMKQTTFEADNFTDQQLFERWWTEQTIFGEHFKEKAQIIWNKCCELRPTASELPARILDVNRLERLNEDMRAGYFSNDVKVNDRFKKGEFYKEKLERFYRRNLFARIKAVFRPYED